METALGGDFSHVRVHTGPAAARAAASVGAAAFTVGSRVVFGAGRADQESRAGAPLLAHELVHAQQARHIPARAPERIAPADDPAELEASTPTARPSRPASPATLYRQPARDPPARPPQTPAPVGPRGWQPGRICGRASRRNVDFPDTYIRTVRINLSALGNGLRIEWANPRGTIATGPYPFSPGAGLCCNDCDDVTVSQTRGSLCTPKGAHPVTSVSDNRCALGGHPTARNPTYFQRAGVAIHSGNLPGFPASHGCARTRLGASEIIHDNSIAGRTVIDVTGTWSSTRCYLRESDDNSVARSAHCVGTTRRPPPRPAPAPPRRRRRPRAEAEPEPETGTGIRLARQDGPGPRNG
jgi:Domain of unknown function (DUF4157)